MCAFVAFLIAHVAMVALTGLVRNMNHIVLGTDDSRTIGVTLQPGLGGRSAWPWRSDVLATWGACGGIPG